MTRVRQRKETSMSVSRICFALGLLVLSCGTTEGAVTLRRSTQVDLLSANARTGSTTLSQITERRAQSDFQEDLDGEDNSEGAYLKCYSLMDQVTDPDGDETLMSQEQYMEFLELMTNGDVSYTQFGDLPAIFVLIFYTAACQADDDCVGGDIAMIEVGDTANPSDTIQLFCKHMLKETVSKAEASFEYTIRYPETVAEQDLVDCLNTATVNALLAELANCPVIDEISENARRMLAEFIEEDTEVESGYWAAETYKQANKRRALQSLGTVTSDNEECRYQISSSVDRITDLRKYLMTLSEWHSFGIYR